MGAASALTIGNAGDARMPGGIERTEGKIICVETTGIVAIKKKIKFMTGINYLAVVVATAAAFLFRKADRLCLLQTDR